MCLICKYDVRCMPWHSIKLWTVSSLTLGHLSIVRIVGGEESVCHLWPRRLLGNFNQNHPEIMNILSVIFFCCSIAVNHYNLSISRWHFAYLKLDKTITFFKKKHKSNKLTSTKWPRHILDVLHHCQNGLTKMHYKKRN